MENISMRGVDLEYFFNPKTNEYRILDSRRGIVVKIIPKQGKEITYSVKIWTGHLDTSRWNTKSFTPTSHLANWLSNQFNYAVKVAKTKFK